MFISYKQHCKFSTLVSTKSMVSQLNQTFTLWNYGCQKIQHIWKLSCKTANIYKFYWLRVVPDILQLSSQQTQCHNIRWYGQPEWKAVQLVLANRILHDWILIHGSNKNSPESPDPPDHKNDKLLNSVI